MIPPLVHPSTRQGDPPKHSYPLEQIPLHVSHCRAIHRFRDRDRTPCDVLQRHHHSPGKMPGSHCAAGGVSPGAGSHPDNARCPFGGRIALPHREAPHLDPQDHDSTGPPWVSPCSIVLIPPDSRRHTNYRFREARMIPLLIRHAPVRPGIHAEQDVLLRIPPIHSITQKTGYLGSEMQNNCLPAVYCICHFTCPGP